MTETELEQLRKDWMIGEGSDEVAKEKIYEFGVMLSELPENAETLKVLDYCHDYKPLKTRGTYIRAKESLLKFARETGAIYKTEMDKIKGKEGDFESQYIKEQAFEDLKSAVHSYLG